MIITASSTSNTSDPIEASDHIEERSGSTSDLIPPPITQADSEVVRSNWWWTAPLPDQNLMNYSYKTEQCMKNHFTSPSRYAPKKSRIPSVSPGSPNEFEALLDDNEGPDPSHTLAIDALDPLSFLYE